jgi:hypothetical protein
MSLLGLALLGLAKLPYRIAKAAGQRFLEAKRTRKVAIPKNGHLGVFQLHEDRDARCAVPFYGNGRTKFRGPSIPRALWRVDSTDVEM